MAVAETVYIDGPDGPLGGEFTPVDDADDLVIIVPGSGNIDRDGNGPMGGLNSDLYKLLAIELFERGIPSIRIDKRGLFSSADAIADANNVTLADYADDVLNWADYGTRHADCIWVAGHSEGALVGLIAATQQPEALCGLILLAAPGRKPAEILLEQLATNPDNAPFMPDIQNVIDQLSDGILVESHDMPPELRGFFAPAIQPFMIDLFATDPIALAAGWNGPMIVIQGDRDIQITMIDATNLTDAAPDAQLVVLPSATHMLKPDVSGQPMATYYDPNIPLHPDLANAIATYIQSAD